MLREASAQVVGDLLEFGDRTAGEIMVPRVRVAALPIDAHLSELRALLRTSPHTRYPVYDGDLDHIVGMLHVRDAVRSLRQGAGAPEYVRAVPHLPATATTEQLLVAMRNAGVQMAVVMDEHGGTAGIVTLEDLFEEVVGQISGRPTEVPEISVEGPRRVRVDGAVRLEEVGESLGVVLEHEDVDSVSGLVLALLGRPPRIGDRVEYDDVFFEVTALRGNGPVQIDLRTMEGLSTFPSYHTCLGLILIWCSRGSWVDRKSTRLNSSHSQQSRMPSSA